MAFSNTAYNTGGGGMSPSKTFMSGTRTQFYYGNGTGRDTYIYNNNGGFCPAGEPTKIEELGKLHLFTIYGPFTLSYVQVRFTLVNNDHQSTYPPFIQRLSNTLTMEVVGTLTSQTQQVVCVQCMLLLNSSVLSTTA